MSHSIALLPLDERPVSTRLPLSIAQLAGLDCVLPPQHLLPSIRRSGDLDMMVDWLAAIRGDSVATIVSLDGLGFGGLVPSRIGDERVAEVIARWRVLDTPGSPVSAFTLVPRAPRSVDAMEEPGYWDPYGPALHQLSAALAARTGVDDARAAVPAAVRQDWIRRRLRQHTLAMHAIGLVADGSIRRLVIGIDDASERSLSATDQQSLDEWIDRCEVGDQAIVQPGADEIAAILVARACLDVLDVPPPRIGIRCAEPTALDRVASYESTPVSETVVRQIRAAGGIPVTDGSAEVDAILVIHPPEAAAVPLADWATSQGAPPDPALARATALEFTRAASDVGIVGIADVARPNGADPTLILALDDAAAWSALSGFAAWNTAGNSIGTVAAQLVATFCAHRAGTVDAGVSRAVIARRLVEDYGWMSVERATLRAELGLAAGRHDRISVSSAILDVVGAAERRLNSILAERDHFHGLSIRAGSLTLPWNRAFEIDLLIEDEI